MICEMCHQKCHQLRCIIVSRERCWHTCWITKLNISLLPDDHCRVNYNLNLLCVVFCFLRGPQEDEPVPLWRQLIGVLWTINIIWSSDHMMQTRGGPCPRSNVRPSAFPSHWCWHEPQRRTRTRTSAQHGWLLSKLLRHSQTQEPKTHLLIQCVFYFHAFKYWRPVVSLYLADWFLPQYGWTVSNRSQPP